MSSPITALKSAIRARLVADTALVQLLRAPKVHPEPPRHPTYPYLAFLAAEARENGTGSDDGHIVDMTLGAFTRGTGSGEGADLGEAVRRALGDPLLQPAGHHLVNLTVRSVEPVAQKDGASWRTLIRIRAITEVV